MSNFFKHAPISDTHQKRFLEALRQRRNIIVSLPLSYSTTSLYGLTAMMMEGMMVVVSPGSRQIRRNLEFFRQAGFKFPDVAFLDGTQMPHEERQIQKEINFNRVRLLYVTPQRFTSLTFLEILVHAEISCLVIEEADRLLPVMPGHGSYRKFLEEGLNPLRKRPPFVLLTPPLAPDRIRELGETLQIANAQLLQMSPLIDPIEIQVKRRFTEHQKFLALVQALSGYPGEGKLGNLDLTGAVFIQTAYPAQAERLGGSLVAHGFDGVWVSHAKHSAQEQDRVLEIANTRPNAIIVQAGIDPRAWAPPLEAIPQLVFWTPPLGLDDLLMQVFRQCSVTRQEATMIQSLKALVFHTKEDYQAATRRIQASRYLDAEEAQARILALKQYRQWILSRQCRLKSLAAYWGGSSASEIASCGRCDYCLKQRHDSESGSKKTVQASAIGSLLDPILERWLF